MFILDENQEHNFLLILNEINHHINQFNNDDRYQQQRSDNHQTLLSGINKRQTTTTTTLGKQNNQKNKLLFEITSITGFNYSNRQCLIDFIINSIQYFNTFFRYTSSNNYDDCFNNTKSKCIIFWLSIFYNNNLFENIDFEYIFDTMIGEESITYHSNDKSLLQNIKENGAKNKLSSNGVLLSSSVPTTSNHSNNIHQGLHHLQQQSTSSSDNPQSSLYQQQQTLSNLNNEFNNNNNVMTTNNNVGLSSFHHHHQQQLSSTTQQHLSKSDQQLFNVEQQNQFNYQLIRSITFICLLLSVIYYKLRYLFPTFINLSRTDISWKLLINFERDIEISFKHDSFLEFLQNELLQQRLSNKKRIDTLKQEVKFMDKMCKIVDKEMETEINKFVTQNRILNNTNNNNNNNNQLQQLSTTMYSPGQNKPPNKLQQSSSTMYDAASTSINSDDNSQKNLKGLRPCEQCGKVFRNSYKLNRHLYVHKDPSEKPFVCNWENCNYRSISKNDLNRHRMIHTGEKPYVCEVNGCEKRYSRADKLRNHKLNVHFKDSNRKEQICLWPGCNFRCHNKSELNRHQLTHEGIKCNFVGCDKIFDKMDKLKKHLEKDHIEMEMSSINDFGNNSSNHFATISVTSTPDIATVAESTNHHHHIQHQQQQQQSQNHQSGNLHHHNADNSNLHQQQQIQQMLTQNQLNTIAALHHHSSTINNDDDNPATKLSSNHMTLTTTHLTSDLSSTTQHHVNNNNNTTTTTASSPMMSNNNNDSNNSTSDSRNNHRQQNISVWSS